VIHVKKYTENIHKSNTAVENINTPKLKPAKDMRRLVTKEE
jgi:hypothetical protein